MPERPFRVLAVASHPVQYMSPIFRRMAAHPSLDLHVVYCSMKGAEAAHDADFGTTVQWDVPLLDGYSWSQTSNRGDGGDSFFGLRNSGLWHLIRDGGYDAVLCFTGYVKATFWIALTAAKFSNTAFLFGTDTTTLAPRDGQNWKIAFKKVVWPWLFGMADQVIVPSSGSRDLMISLGLAEERVTLTPYSVDNDWWMLQSSQVDREKVRASWTVAADDTVVLFCAKLQSWKRPLDLLKAFAKGNFSNTVLVFAGEGPQRRQLEVAATELGVASRVCFLGFVNQSQLPGVYTASDVMVLPSSYEPFAVVVNEAMCCGCAVIASDRVGAARDLIAPVSPEFIYPSGNVEVLAGILRTALEDRARLHAVGQAARQHIQTWSPERNIEATVEAIRTAVNRKGRKEPEAESEVASTKKNPAATQKLHE
jgi:glycosyltransferase involved in cell wall biosynthesis